jgi:hypothetical protein
MSADWSLPKGIGNCKKTAQLLAQFLALANHFAHVMKWSDPMRVGEAKKGIISL